MDRVTREVIPASRPTAASVAGAGAMVSSTSIETNQRPALSRDTVTVVGSAPSGSGRDQRMSRGSAVLARVSRPSRHVKALRVYSADDRDFFRLL
ncbi:exosome complex RNA-binding protein Csl4 [Streptomyces stelliscabiei]|uniref:Exosome complex RNA-binding protein Csl4 n=1 Tax=Streptomyces stelliscabiei TaxID=146820 RepID=A0A8I0TWX7_9ACTN|nr:exosome complex RNA-binding protein Csl4 [Streptomyces stelliscabiei]